MELRIIDSIPAFEKIKQEIEQRTLESYNSSPFLTHRWLLSWWKAYRNNCKVEVLCFYKQNKLVLFLPIVFEKSTYARIRVKGGSLVGSKLGVNIPLSDDVKGWESVFLSWLMSKDSDEWNLFEFGPFHQSPSYFQHMLHLLQEKNLSYKTISFNNPYLSLNGNWDSFLKSCTSNFRRTVKRKEKKIREQRSYKITSVLNPDIITIKKTLYIVSKKSWQGQKGVAKSSTAEGRNFYKYLACNGEFDIDLTALFDGEKCIAYLLGLIMDHTYYAFDTGYDPEYSDLSPGLLLHHDVLKNACVNNITEFNFGFNHSYKDRFDPSFHTLSNIRIFRNRRLLLVDKLRSLVKRADN